MVVTNIFLALSFLFSGCTSSDSDMVGVPQENTGSTSQESEGTGLLSVKLNFKRSGTIASNQYAVWIENAEGKLIKTLYVSDFTANGGYARRKDCIPTWVAKARPSQMPEAALDAVSGATPRSNGVQTYSWDGKDETGQLVEAGQYHVYVEGTLYWSGTVLFSGVIDWGGRDQRIKLVPVFSEEEVTNRDMITQVTAEYAGKA